MCCREGYCYKSFSVDFAGASRMQFYKGGKAEFIAILRWYSLSAYPMLAFGGDE